MRDRNQKFCEKKQGTSSFTVITPPPDTPHPPTTPPKKTTFSMGKSLPPSPTLKGTIKTSLCWAKTGKESGQRFLSLELGYRQVAVLNKKEYSCRRNRAQASHKRAGSGKDMQLNKESSPLRQNKSKSRGPIERLSLMNRRAGAAGNHIKRKGAGSIFLKRTKHLTERLSLGKNQGGDHAKNKKVRLAKPSLDLGERGVSIGTDIINYRWVSRVVNLRRMSRSSRTEGKQ